MLRYNWKQKKSYYENFLKKRKRRVLLKRLVSKYRDFRLQLVKRTTSLETLYFSIFIIRQRVRQHHYAFVNLNTNKCYTFSTGHIIAQYGNYGKFFKKSPTNIPGIALQFKKTKSHLLERIYLLSIRNFNKKQYSFFEKLFSLSTYKILYFVHRKSYIGQPQRKHRIARTVLRSLQKQEY